MKKIIVLEAMSNLPTEEAIYVFVDSSNTLLNKLVKVVSTKSIHLRTIDKTTSQFGNISISKKQWAIRSIRFREKCSEYAILHPDCISKENMLYNRSLTKEAFLFKLQEWYPDEYEFFLWHPEVFEGKWNKD